MGDVEVGNVDTRKLGCDQMGSPPVEGCQVLSSLLDQSSFCDAV
jgi:hypothetical protein